MATYNNEQKFNAQPPVYIKHTDVSMIKGNTLITICNAANNSVKNQVLGATKARGIWNLYVKSYEARVFILTNGLIINNHYINLFDENPYTHRSGGQSEKIIFKGLPLEHENDHISDFLKKFPQIETRSNIIYAKEKDVANDIFSPYYNGERYVFVNANFTPPLPKEVKIGNQHCQIYHQSQKQWCFRCRDADHPHATNDVCKCNAYTPDNGAIVFKSRYNVLCNYFMCELHIWGHTFASAEHAYQWYKCTELNKFDLAEKVIMAPYAKDAKALTRDAFTKDEMETWSKKKINIMREVLAAKADSSHLLRTSLLQSGKKRIIEATEDTFWGVGMNPFLASTTKHEYFPHGSNQLGLLLEQIRDVLIQSAAQSEQQQIGELLAVGNNQPEDAIRYKPILDTHTNHGNDILSLQTIQKEYITSLINDDRDSAKGSQHTARVIQPISPVKRSTYGTPEKTSRAHSATPKRPRPSPDVTRSPKKVCTPISSPVKQTLIQGKNIKDPKHAGSSTESGNKNK